MYLETLIFILFTSVCYYYFFSQASKARKFAAKIGGPPGNFILGNALKFIKNSENTLITLSNWVDEYGDRFVFYFGPLPVFVVNNAEDLEKVFTSNELLKKSREYDMVREWLGNGLITSTGTHWFHRRKLLTPTFHLSVLERFIAPINIHAKVLSEVLHENFIANNKEKYVEVFPFIARCALDIICETSMGIQLNVQKSQVNMSYVNSVHKLGELFQYRTIRPWLASNLTWSLTPARREECRCLNIIHSFTDRVIANRKNQFSVDSESKDTTSEAKNDTDDTCAKVKLAMLDMLIEAQKMGNDISDAGIREETSTFIFAGYDTISAAISFCLFNLGNNLKAQEKLQQEVDNIFLGDKSRAITSADLREMKYLECCIKESLRLYPSVPIIGRQVSCDFSLDKDTVIPAGTTVYVPIIKLHRNAKYFPQPNDFIPERFEAGSSLAHTKPFAFVPFSAGARNCIGQKLAMIEAKILLATIIRRFNVKAQHKPEDLQLLSEIVLKVKGGIKISLQERSN